MDDLPARIEIRAADARTFYREVRADMFDVLDDDVEAILGDVLEPDEPVIALFAAIPNGARHFLAASRTTIALAKRDREGAVSVRLLPISAVQSIDIRPLHGDRTGALVLRAAATTNGPGFTFPIATNRSWYRCVTIAHIIRRLQRGDAFDMATAALGLESYLAREVFSTGPRGDTARISDAAVVAASGGVRVQASRPGTTTSPAEEDSGRTVESERIAAIAKQGDDGGAGFDDDSEGLTDSAAQRLRAGLDVDADDDDPSAWFREQARAGSSSADADQAMRRMDRAARDEGTAGDAQRDPTEVVDGTDADPSTVAASVNGERPRSPLEEAAERVRAAARVTADATVGPGHAGTSPVGIADAIAAEPSESNIDTSAIALGGLTGRGPGRAAEVLPTQSANAGSRFETAEEWDDPSDNVRVTMLPRPRTDKIRRDATEAGTRRGDTGSKKRRTPTQPLDMDAMQEPWYLYRGSAQHGPYSYEQLREWFRAGKLGSNEFVRARSMKQWRRVHTAFPERG